MNYHNGTQTSDILEDLIKIQNHTPSPKRIKHATATSTAQLIMNKNDQNTRLSIDVNYATNGTINCQYNEIRDIHSSNKPDNKDKIKLSNQTLGAMSLYLRKPL